MDDKNDESLAYSCFRYDNVEDNSQWGIEIRLPKKRAEDNLIETLLELRHLQGSEVVSIQLGTCTQVYSTSCG